MLVRISGVHPCNLLADWELWLTAPAQHHKTAPYHMSLALFIKTQIQNSKYSFY